MQIFCPYADFTKTAIALDGKRLNKQKVELYQILNTISRGDAAKGWKNHPAVKMARGYERFFIEYGLSIAMECLNRNYKDTLIPKIEHFKSIFDAQYKIPHYWGDERLHSSHRSALLFKNYEHYSQFGWTETPKIDYHWAV